MKRTITCIHTAVLFLCHSSLAVGTPASNGLIDPDLQPKFTVVAPNLLDRSLPLAGQRSAVDIAVRPGVVETGLVDPTLSVRLKTSIYGYDGTWPGPTLMASTGQTVSIQWLNELPVGQKYLLTGKDNGEEWGNYENISVVDTSHHWCYSMEGYDQYNIPKHGVPIIPHLHGGHTDPLFDGNPEYFFSPNFEIKGPQWKSKIFEYQNQQAAAALWYHDHALGLTRLNVYAGMAGFYILRDEQDSGVPENPLRLPVYPYEVPLLIQDRMFKSTGDLFYPSHPGDPNYVEFVTKKGASVDPSILSEFFGDFMLVNGKIWPKINVEPRNYRFRLLNGCDSRYLVIQLLVTNLNQTNVNLTDASVLPYLVIGGDQGLTNQPRQMTTLIVEPSARLDLIVNFRGLEGKRILMKNMGGDKAFGGNIPGPQIFEHTDKIMALDVTLPLNTKVLDSFDPNSFHPVVEALPNKVDRVRRLGLFEGTGFFGRHQPLLGTVEPAINPYGNPIHWPKSYHHAGLIGTMTGSMSWHDPVTEIVRLGDTEDWQLFNLSPDAHPIHLHLVNFTVVSRRFIQFDSNANDHGKLEEGSLPKGDGTYFVEQATLHHDGKIGQGWRAENPTIGDFVNESSLTEYNDNLVRDVVTVLPGQVTTIRARFERPGRFNWHCHMMSHEDDEMMRLYYVEEAPNKETKSLRRDGTNERSPRRHNKLFLESILGHIKEMSFGG